MTVCAGGRLEQDLRVLAANGFWVFGSRVVTVDKIRRVAEHRGVEFPPVPLGLAVEMTETGPVIVDANRDPVDIDGLQALLAQLDECGFGTPRRIQLQRTKGWRKPLGAVVVSRPSKWGNPYRVTQCHRTECGSTSGWCVADAANRVHTRMPSKTDAAYAAVARFEEVWAHPNLQAEIAGALRGRVLACWCPLDQPCHADVLLEIANSPSPAGRAS